jgi:predicted PurR-regulated permease PerM
VQSIMGGIGLAIAGVPFVGVLTALMFILAVAQIGAGPILFAVVAWMYWDGATGWATGLLVWSIIVSSMDNVLRPILIRRGGDLPLLLVFAGVIGGLVAFGLVGIFVGPLVLAVSYRLLQAWVAESAPPP